MRNIPLANTGFLADNKKKPVQSAETAVQVELPVKGGRSSVPDHNGLYTALFGDMALISPDFNVKVFDLMDFLGKYNADVSYALDNIVQLSNTEYSINFGDNTTAEQAAEMIKHIKAVSKTWYSHSGGLNSLQNDLFAQIGLTGCLSAEVVPKDDLSGVKKAVLVNPKNIEFLYERAKDEYIAYQKNTNAYGSGMFEGGLGRMKLNPVTYKYYAIRRFNEKPYAIPPFLSALENIDIEKDMMCNFRHIIKQLGAFGFLEVLLTAPSKLPPASNGGQIESDGAYQERLRTYLNNQVPEIEKSLAKGFVAGFKGSHEFEMKGNIQNPEGARKLFEMNTEMKMSGLKQDPLMLGRNYNTTETLGKVIITKLSAQLQNYQKLVATFLEEMFLLELRLGGYMVDNVIVEFEVPSLSDQVKDAQAFKLKIENYNALYNQGVIDQQQRSQALGWEKPAEEEPRMGAIDPNAGKTDVPIKDETKVSKIANEQVIEDMNFFLGGKVIEFDYFSGNACGHDHSHEHHTEELNFSLSDKEAEAILNKYLEESTANYSATVQRVVKTISKKLFELGATASLQAVMDTVFYSLYNEMGGTFLTKQRGIIQKWLTGAYKSFREDKSPFGTIGSDKIPKATLGLADMRTLNYFKNSDGLYMGKFITDADTTKKIQKFINENYFGDGNLHLGKNPQAIAEFRKQFGDLLQGEDWKIQRILSTTVNTMKSYASVSYLQQGEIAEFEIRGVVDRLQCGFCREMQGKRFSVARAAEIVSKVTSSDPADVRLHKPFLNTAFKKVEDLQNATREQLEASGAIIPAFHSGCRDRIVAVI